MNIDIDKQFEEHEITSVDDVPGYGWTINMGGLGIGVPSRECSEPPAVGEKARMYGRGLGHTVRGIAINGRVYRYETPEQHEVSRRELCERLASEREERDRKFRESPKPELPKFECSDPEGWAECVKNNSTDPYSFECVRYAAAWASAMEARGVGTLIVDMSEFADVAKECSSEADTSGITGFMYGAAVSMLAKFWVCGDALRRWHNLDTQVGDEGERANATGGTLNPALLTVG